MVNSYYASMPDRLYERFSNTQKRKEFFNELRSYLLEEYNYNLTSFIEDVCDTPEQDEDFWMMVAEDGSEPRQIVDDIFAEFYQGKRQRHNFSSYLGSEGGNRENPFQS